MITLWVVFSYLWVWFNGHLLDACSFPIGWSVTDQLFYQVPIIGGGYGAGNQINVIPEPGATWQYTWEHGVCGGTSSRSSACRRGQSHREKETTGSCVKCVEEMEVKPKG